MKPSKSEITEYLKRLHKARLPHIKAAKELEDAIACAAETDDIIKKIGEPDFRDDAAIQRLSSARMKRDLCAKAIERIQSKNTGAFEAQSPCVKVVLEGAQLVIFLLQDVLSQRLRTISACLLPFSASKGAAESVATRTDAYQHALFGLRPFTLMNGVHYIALSAVPADTFKSTCDQIEAVLTEAIKDSPDINQFLPFVPVATNSQSVEKV